MFDAVLNRANVPQTRIGTGAIIALALHAALIAFAIWISVRPPPVTQEKDLAVKFMLPPPPPPPPPASVKRKVEVVERKPVRKPDTIVQPKEAPTEKPPEAEPQDNPDEGQEGGVEGGVVGGVIGGVVGGTIGGTPGGAIGGKLIEIDESNIKLKKLSGPDPKYTDQALEHEVQGTMVVKCVVTAEGSVNTCRVLKSLPYMDRPVIEALERWKYQPYLVDGRPAPVEYTFRLKLMLPQ